MLLTIERFFDDGKATLGLLKVQGKFECFTLEDEYREVKVPGETRIPKGVFDVQLRTHGGFHQRYAAHPRIGAVHKGMLQVMNVPGFTDILIHCGNDEGDTAGCVLIGLQALTEPGNSPKVGRSVDAYLNLYPRVAATLLDGKNVTLEVMDRDR